MKVTLDAGHGGYDAGAVAYSTKEKDITNEFTNLLSKKLKARGVDVYQIANELNSYETNEYSKNANLINADDRSEIHVNAGGGKGSEILLRTGQTPNAIDNAWLEVLVEYFNNRGFKYRSDLQNMNWCKNYKGRYRLPELFFIDYKADLETWNNKKEIITDKLAEKLAPLMGGKAMSNDYIQYAKVIPTGNRFQAPEHYRIKFIAEGRIYKKFSENEIIKDSARPFKVGEEQDTYHLRHVVRNGRKYNVHGFISTNKEQYEVVLSSVKI